MQPFTEIDLTKYEERKTKENECYGLRKMCKRNL